LDDVVVLDLLSKHPVLRKRIERILGVAADLNENIELADAAEEQLIEEGRHLNREALQAWASNKVNQSAIRFENKHKNTRKDIKKNSVGIAHSESFK
jgi:hypothetical protein